MSVCPECNATPLTQQKDKRLFICSNPECPVRYFTLINRKDLKDWEEQKARKCMNCGVFTTLEPSGLCKKCAKELAKLG